MNENLNDELTSQTSTENDGQAIIQAYLAIVEQQSAEISEPNRSYGEFSNSGSWKQFSNHSKPFSQGG